MNRLRRFAAEDFVRHLERVRRRGFAAPPGAEEAVAAIVAAVREQGDAAVLEFTARYDGVSLPAAALEVAREEIGNAYGLVDEAFLGALRRARERIAAFHRWQLSSGYQFRDEGGNTLGLMVRPLERVGIYVPGGRASYPSSVLMAAVPARIAGVGEVVMCTPPGPAGRVDPAVLVAAAEAGVDRVFRVGGAQAVAAMAFGTERIPRVDKIVGPGNIYVTLAKRLVFGSVAIDGLHGPSEVAVVADAGADPEWVAADLLAQAEHDPLAAAVLVTPEAALVDAVEGALGRLLEAAPRREVAERALEGQGAAVVVRDLEEAFAVVNRLAPEHLEIMVADPFPWLERVRHAGAVFLGYHAPVPAGDYAAGTNHVLPTGGTARFFSGLGVWDFVRTVSYFHGAPGGVTAWAPASVALAEREGLPGHAAAAALRLGANGRRESASSGPLSGGAEG